MIHNERGMTLVEVLATITILSIVGVVIWNIFFQGMNYTKKAVSQNRIQQEANVINMKLTRIHQNINDYTIESSDCEIKVIYKGKDKDKSPPPFHDDRMCFALEQEKKDNGSNHISLTVSDKFHTNNTIVLETVLYRLGGKE